ncbi:helix-turn-helix domain-containing protein [Streptomyces sp. WAC06614]|uniref:helix-turn-helix domain-containing protein n=1 Tax=Streptomyces sp. WAC06614 TaxID=2487416 RepID=UPI000F79B5A1|nr:helix-turn-helix transcriptional regulator [Streptomyces sp. WAC06614]RSS84473.1 XRE family transcriptional regulator [Streptomyces sp. WAC06614]
MDGQSSLGAFLQARRSRLRPADIGLATYGERRRVPGLRREELALLAGVSASYYARLEQGHAHHASPEVLDALARALDLDEAERRHVHDLAGRAVRRPAARRPPAERVDPATLRLLDSMPGVPAVLTGHRADVLAWNPLGHALFAGHVDPTAPDRPADRPNMAALIFLDPYLRELYVSWESKARAAVANLRYAAGRHPDDALLGSLIGELSMQSTEFATLWADHRARPCTSAEQRMWHPLVGTLTVTQQALRVTEDQTLLVATAPAGSPDHTALTLLAQATAHPAAS